jgi:hypothetical protein
MAAPNFTEIAAKCLNLDDGLSPHQIKRLIADTSKGSPLARQDGSRTGEPHNHCLMVGDVNEDGSRDVINRCAILGWRSCLRHGSR